jgi:hypothetical protein
MMPIAVYVAFCLLVLWASLRHRSPGWRSGLLFGLLALSIPLWVMGMYWLFLLVSGNLEQ